MFPSINFKLVVVGQINFSLKQQKLKIFDIIFIEQFQMGCAPTSQTVVVVQNPHSLKKMRNKSITKRKNIHPDQFTQQFQIISPKPTDEQVNFAINKLTEHQLFGVLSKRQLKTIAEQMIYAKNKLQEKYIFKQGDIGCCFFLILKGTVEVEINGKFIRKMTKGETFGELALLFSCPRTASILCPSGKNCQFLIMKPSIYKKTLKKMKLEQQSKNLQTIQKVPLFSCLTNKQIHALSNNIKMVLFNPGETIFKTGDDALAMYIISQGNVKIQIEGKKDIELLPGQMFGESSIQQNMRRSGTAISLNKTICSMISRQDIEDTLGSSINNLMFYNLKKWAVLRSPIFKDFQPQQLNHIIISFQLFFVKDQTIIDPNLYEGLIICHEGQINKKGQNTIFNEQNWLKKNYKCQNSLIKNGDGYCSYLPFSKLQQICQDIQNKTKIIKFKHKAEKTKQAKFNLSEFIYLKKLGEGQFGQVFLVKNIQFGPNLYAIKCLSKEYIKRQKMEQSVIQQKKILQKTIFPYIVGFVKAFQDDKYIYLLMEYIHGKQMFDVIRQVKSMTSEMVKYYFACLLISVQYLHSNNIVYRDIKPENSVVDSRGKVYLIDMGTAKQLTSENFFKTFTIIGTPHYMAPQVFQGNGYSFEADLWSLGCLLYQFMCYSLPFGDNVESDAYAVYTAIKKNSLVFPKFIKDEKAKKLVTQLLSKNAKMRSQLSFDKIKKSQYFKGFSWGNLIQQQLKAPYIPREFRNNPLQQLHKMEGVDFLKNLYKNDRKHLIQQWNNNEI